MRLRFTKMQGAGNDFVVLDSTRERIELTPQQMRHLGDRHFGIGADQILIVDPSPEPGVDFGYRIFNNSGDEVEHCGNGARCFVRFVRDKGLSAKDRIRVRTVNRLLELQLHEDGQVTVDMGEPQFGHEAIPFVPGKLRPRELNGFALWPLQPVDLGADLLEVAVLSMGNPHAVARVAEVDATDVHSLGREVQAQECFPAQVNVGFMQVLSRGEVKLRVYERGAGETLACGTGACAAVVAGIRLGWLGSKVQVHTRGGVLGIEWACAGQPVRMTGPAQTVFEGDIEL